MGNVGASFELRGIRKSYGIGKDRLVRAADDVTLTIEAGAFVALTGASGSGKSTLLHSLGTAGRHGGRPGPPMASPASASWATGFAAHGPG